MSEWFRKYLMIKGIDPDLIVISEGYNMFPKTYDIWQITNPRL